MKKTKKILVVLLAVVMLCQVFLCILPVAAADEEDLAYSNVWNDLQASSTFMLEYDAGFYRWRPKEYSLEVITIAESEDRELFVYVYQPSGQSSKIQATSIDISITERNDEKEFKTYDLVFVNSYDVFFKYKVKDFKVNKDEIRYYEILDIFRPWSSKYGDADPGAGNTVSEVAYPVGKFFTFSGNSMQKVEDVEYIMAENQIVGFVRYDRDCFLPWLTGKQAAVDSHFIAFSTKNKIDCLLEVSLTYYHRGVRVTDLNTDDPSYEYSNKTKSTVIVDLEDEQYFNLADGNFFTKQPLIRQRIQETSNFIDQDLTYSYFASIEDHDKVDFQDDALDKLKQTQWVVSFAETAYSLYNEKVSEYVRISDVHLMRLKFETDGNIYNLGVVSNKQTGSEDPAAVVESTEWWQKIMMVLMLILLLLALMFIWPIVSPVFRIIGIGIKNIFKILIWILMLPSKLFRKIFKLLDKHQSKRRKTSIQNTKGKVKK